MSKTPAATPRGQLVSHELLEAIADLDDLAELPARQLLELVLDDARQRMVLRVPGREGRHEGADSLDGIVGGLLERPLDDVEDGLVADAADLEEQVVLRLPVHVDRGRAHPCPLADLARRRGVDSRARGRRRAPTGAAGARTRARCAPKARTLRSSVGGSTSPLPPRAGRHDGESRRRDVVGAQQASACLVVRLRVRAEPVLRRSDRRRLRRRGHARPGQVLRADPHADPPPQRPGPAAEHRPHPIALRLPAPGEVAQTVSATFAVG